MLFAIYGLNEVERIERLEQEAAVVRGAFLQNYAFADPKKLMAEQRMLMQRVRAGDDRPDVDREALARDLVELGALLKRNKDRVS